MNTATELDDLQLKAAQKGRPAATRALVLMYQHRVFAVCSRMLACRGLSAAVEDVAQETFGQVFTHLKRFQTKGSARLSTWILTIATRRCIDRIRADERRARRETWAAAPQPAPAPDTTVLGRQLAALVGALPPEQHAVFVLRAFHEFEVAEIGAALKLPTGTVKSRLSRARARLRQALAHEHEQ